MNLLPFLEVVAARLEAVFKNPSNIKLEGDRDRRFFAATTILRPVFRDSEEDVPSYNTRSVA
jgi:hypothetical protein